MLCKGAYGAAGRRLISSAPVSSNSRHRLQVVVTQDCSGCAEALSMVRRIRASYPDLAIEVIDLERGPVPESVFAVPTYLLDGRIISLGNPSRGRLEQKIEEALEEEG